MVLVGGILVLAVFILALPFLLIGLIIFFLVPRKQTGFRFFTNVKNSPYSTFNQNPEEFENQQYTPEENEGEIIDVQAKEVKKELNNLSE
jgi:hypothetical protein